MTAATVDNTHAYLREVRRARHLHRGNPVKLHGALRQLSDVRPISLEGKSQAIEVDPKAVFAVAVANALDAGILRYTKRTQLLRKAATLGIARFEANLIIAREEHKAGKGWTPERETAKRKIPMGWITFAAVQLMIVGALWWMLF